MRKMFTLLILLVFISPAYAATTYKWVDKEGVVNYTDDYNKIPSEYRDRVETEVREDTPTIVPSPAPQVSPQTREEAKTDIYGRDEIWWRERVRPWNDRLKEAEANYERAHNKFMEKAEEFSRGRFGSWSRTQYKMNIIELDRLKEEMLKYGDQVAEAKEALEKISKEAREAKANPEWLQ